MKFIKNELKKLNKNYTNFFNNFKITNILIILLTLYAIIINFGDYYFIPLSILIMLPIIFYAEYSHKKLAYLIGVILGILFGILLSGKPPIHLVLIYVGLILVFTVFDFYIVIKREKSIPKYLCKLFESLLQVYIISYILMFGVTSLFLLTDFMIFGSKLTEYIYICFYLVGGLYVLPSTIMSVVYSDDKVSKISDILISKVLMIIMDLYFVIVLIYVLKGLIVFKYSIYEVHIIIGFLFMMFLPLSIMASNYEGLFYKINSKYLKYVFIVPLLLQIYTVFNQISTYGFTIMRYIGLMFIIFEVVTLGLLIYKDNKYIIDSLLVLCTLLIVTFIIPGCNIRDVVLSSQVNRLTKLYPVNLDYNSLSKSDKKEINDIYNYIIGLDRNSKDKIPDYIDKSNFKDYDVYESDNNYFHFSIYNKKELVNVDKYKLIEFVSNDGKGNTIKLGNYNCDFSDYLEVADELRDEVELEKYVGENDLIHLDTNTDFYITHISGEVKEDGYEMGYVEGILLYK